MISPREANMALLGLGYSVGTPPGGITAEVLVVYSFDDLKASAGNVSSPPPLPRSNTNRKTFPLSRVKETFTSFRHWAK